MEDTANDKDLFILQTAEAYDMDYDDVKNIREKYPDLFHDELELFIKNRAVSNS